MTDIVKEMTSFEVRGVHVFVACHFDRGTVSGRRGWKGRVALADNNEDVGVRVPVAIDLRADSAEEIEALARTVILTADVAVSEYQDQRAEYQRRWDAIKEMVAEVSN